jgi:hypothetical protein
MIIVCQRLIHLLWLPLLGNLDSSGFAAQQLVLQLLLLLQLLPLRDGYVSGCCLSPSRVSWRHKSSKTRVIMRAAAKRGTDNGKSMKLMSSVCCVALLGYIKPMKVNVIAVVLKCRRRRTLVSDTWQAGTGPQHRPTFCAPALRQCRESSTRCYAHSNKLF